jgi:hypothetical protein
MNGRGAPAPGPSCQPSKLEWQKRCAPEVCEKNHYWNAFTSLFFLRFLVKMPKTFTIEMALALQPLGTICCK